MREFWSDKSVIWYNNANNYSNYFYQLANELEDLIKDYHTITDLGCGPGLLSIELAKRNYRVDAFDISRVAINYLNNILKNHPMNNLVPHCENIYTLDNNRLANEVIIASHFGRGDDDFKFITNIPAKKYIIIKNVNHSNSIVGKHRATSNDIVNFLDTSSYNYTTKKMHIEFSQPLRTLYEIEEFKKFYGFNNVQVKEIEGEFNYLILKQKDLRIFCIDSK